MPAADGDVPCGRAPAPAILQYARRETPGLSGLRRLLSIGECPARDDSFLPRPHGAAPERARALSGADRPSLHQLWRPRRRVLHRAGGSWWPVGSTARRVAGAGVDRRPNPLLLRRSASSPRRHGAETRLGPEHRGHESLRWGAVTGD